MKNNKSFKWLGKITSALAGAVLVCSG
ncbi:MAG: hypothetical protein RLY91_1780, partial [Pseudomonadota bacterium]